MKISARAKIDKELYNTHQDLLKYELRKSISNELIKHKIFIEPPMNEINGFVSMEIHFFALSYSDVDKLKELIEKYPEIKNIIENIIIK
jgi:hypothetical protein